MIPKGLWGFSGPRGLKMKHSLNSNHLPGESSQWMKVVKGVNQAVYNYIKPILRGQQLTMVHHLLNGMILQVPNKPPTQNTQWIFSMLKKSSEKSWAFYFGILFYQSETSTAP